LTVENVDELLDDRANAWLSRIWGLPLGVGLAFLLNSAWLVWLQSRISLLRRDHPSAIVVEVSVSKAAKRELASVFLSGATAWSCSLLVRKGSISLWAGLPPRPEVVVEARDVRAFEYDRGSSHGRAAAAIVLEWDDGASRRHVSLAPIGSGLRGLSAPPFELTATAVQRGRELIGLEATRDAD
jgi:hypothetical protein